MISVKVKKIHPSAHLPERKTSGAVGYDLYYCGEKEIKIPPLGVAAVGIGLSFEIPVGCYGRIAPRSSLALNNQVSVGGGVIDPDYRGEVKVILFNQNQSDIFVVKPQERIAQLIFERVKLPIIVEVDALKCTERGEGGFGSTNHSNSVEEGEITTTSSSSGHQSPPKKVKHN